ncbi:hypothetical protein BCR34DRAFT_489046 [Clohesyomyces aquaticus]|uniref:NmrA-like domain-containing protein n=1 Tax=Clohesyomyces aquaticus TaxID=1231657 RepID=A0A1Y1ZCF5_9PLEO|nr:hypothetical protein BCR34DRAFT_489046 [Clohesyomyces aquaticus]
MLAVTSPTGKLGGAVLDALLTHTLVSPSELVVCTSSSPTSPKFSRLHSASIPIRHADFDNPTSLSTAFTNCTKLFLVSTPRVTMDFNNAPLWSGREAHHRAAIDAAVSAGVKHIYYTSLAFGRPSKAAVMRAHIRTEDYLESLSARDITYTVIREGLYNETWPLYFGYYFGLKDEQRTEVLVCGDGEISWTAIEDLGFVTAKIITAPLEQWRNKTLYLSQARTASLKDIADMVSKARGEEEVKVKVVGRKEYEDFYVGMGTERDAVEWWSSTYEALEDGECEIRDQTLESILKEAGRSPKAIEDTVREMMT